MGARAKRRLWLWGSASALAAVAACLLLAQPALAEPAAADVLLYSGNTADSDGFSSFGRAHADYTLEVPASLRVGENASIAYAFSWDGTGAVAQGGKAGHLLLFVPEEISVLDERARPASVWSDAGAPHSATAYYLDVPYAVAGAAGSVGIRLERPLYHDRDVLRAGPHEFQLQRADGGAALADAGSLGDGYDARQMELIRHIHGEDEDPLGRYDVVREPGAAVVAHVPPAALRSSTEPAGRPNLTAADWYDLAAFLEAVHADGGSAAEYASALPFSEASLRAFFDSDARMAEITGYDRGLVTFGGGGSGSGSGSGGGGSGSGSGSGGSGSGSGGGGSGGTPYGGGSTIVTSSASVEPIDPEPIHIEGSYFVRTPHVTVPLFAATACAYDRNSTDGSHTLMYHGRTEACSPVYKSGAFFIRASSWDPDGDGSGPDIVLGVGFNRDSRGLSTVDAAGRPYALMDGRVRHNVSAGDYQEAPITLSPRYERPYAAYRAAVDAHAYFHELGRTAGEAVVQVPSGIDTPLLYEPAGPGGAPAAIKVRGPNAAEVMRGYGHHLMHSLHPDTPTCVSDMAAASGVSCSWAEGWAWFVAAAVGGDSYVSSSDFQIDLESGEYGVFWPDTGFPYEEGVSHSEGWAAAALWDVLDDAAEGGDGIDGTASGGGMAPILDAIGDKRSGDPRPRNVLHWAHLWAPEGSAAMDGVLEHNNIEPDETAPELEAPQGKAFSAEGPATPLDEDDFGTAVAIDYKDGSRTEVIDPDPKVWNNAPDAFPVGDTVITWYASDFSGNVRNASQAVAVADYEPPKIFLNATEAFDGTYPVTPEVLLTRVFAIDIVDPDPALVADFEGELPAGNHTVTWTATDGSGNSDTATHRVTVEEFDKENPKLTVRPVIPINATGIMTWSDLSGHAFVTDDTDPSPSLSHDGPEFLPLGNTIVQWTAMDASGKTSNATSVVSVSLGSGEMALDTDWRYYSTDERAIIPTKTLRGDVNIRSTILYLGDAFFFKSFPKADLVNRTVSVETALNVDRLPRASVSVLDGAYAANSTDFGRDGPVHKGGGVLATYEYGSVPATFEPDWSRSQLDHVTLVVAAEKRAREKYNLEVRSVEFSNHSRWVFGDYRVERDDFSQIPIDLAGTYVFVPPVPEHAYQLPLNDTFQEYAAPRELSRPGGSDEVASGWTYAGSTEHAQFGVDAGEGSAAPSAHLRSRDIDSIVLMAKTVDLSSHEPGNSIVVGTSFKASSISGNAYVTNARLYLFDADTGEQLHAARLANGGTRDTGWHEYREDVTDAVEGADRVRLALGYSDSFWHDHRNRAWFDNVSMTSERHDAPVGTVNTFLDP